MINDIKSQIEAIKIVTDNKGAVSKYTFPDTSLFMRKSGMPPVIRIIINPVTPPKPIGYADDTWTGIEQLFQINVWGDYLSEDLVAQVASAIERELYKIYRFKHVDGAPVEYDKDTGIYNDARRYMCRKQIT